MAPEIWRLRYSARTTCHHLGGVRGQAVGAALDEPAEEPPVEPAGAGDRGGEPGVPADPCAVPIRGQVDVGPVAAQREPGQQGVAEPAVGDQLHDLLPAGYRAGSEDSDRAQTARRPLARAFQL